MNLAGPGGYGVAGILRRASLKSWSLVRKEGWPEAARSSGHRLGAGGYSDAVSESPEDGWPQAARRSSGHRASGYSE